jgi:hypothetical protein
VVPIIERIDLGCASNPMRVLIRLTAPGVVVRVGAGIVGLLREILS